VVLLSGVLYEKSGTTLRTAISSGLSLIQVQRVHLLDSKMGQFSGFLGVSDIWVKGRSLILVPFRRSVFNQFVLGSAPSPVELIPLKKSPYLKVSKSKKGFVHQDLLLIRNVPGLTYESGLTYKDWNATPPATSVAGPPSEPMLQSIISPAATVNESVVFEQVR
jgi:hypothetical protein